MLFWKRNVEKELKALTSQVSQAQTTARIRQRQQRRWTSLFLVYTIFVYSIYLAIAFLSGSYKTTQSKVLITAVPGFIYSFSKTLTRVLQWRENKASARLKTLKAKRDELIEEYKKQTNYYSIQQVLEGAQEVKQGEASEAGKEDKHDKPSKPSKQNQNKNQQRSPQDKKKELIRKVQKESAKARPIGLPESAVDVDTTPQPQPKLPAAFATPAPAPPSKPTFLDRLADLVLGENESAPNNRYALICSKCFTHNGLASYGQDPSEIQYRCPVCGTMNGESSESSEGASPDKPEMQQVSAPNDALNDADATK